MKWILIISFLGLVFLFVEFIKASLESVRDYISLTPQRPRWPYELKESLFTQSEWCLYCELRKQLGDTYDIFSKVRLIDFVNTTAPSDKIYSFNNKIKSEHIDFLLCSKDSLKPQIAIELDGNSHNGSVMQKSDKFKNELFEDIGLEFVRIRVGANFEEEVKRI